MGKTVRLQGYLSKGWGSAVKSAKTDPSPTKAEYNSWVKRPSHKYGSWWTAPGRKDMLCYILARTIQFLNQNTMKKLKNITKKGWNLKEGWTFIQQESGGTTASKLDWIIKTTISRESQLSVQRIKEICGIGLTFAQFTHIITQKPRTQQQQQPRSADHNGRF